MSGTTPSIQTISNDATGQVGGTISHPLDHVVWSALTTQQRTLAEGGALARRFPSYLAPFSAMRTISTEAMAALAALVPAGERIALFTLDEVPDPDPALFSVAIRDQLDQMVWTATAAGPVHASMVTLGKDDVPEMMALVDATRPGPFSARTHELGHYLGIRSDAGKLVAMAGERMRVDGYTEVSAVCVDPSQRGKGYAADLITAVARGILARGELPFLHVFTTNASAIGLYRKLGFARRATMRLTVLDRKAD